MSGVASSHHLVCHTFLAAPLYSFAHLQGHTLTKHIADCAVKGVRRKEDPWNAIIAGFFTGGSLAVRGGARAMRNGAIGCAILLAVIEGVGIGFQRMMAETSTKLEAPPPPPEAVGAKAVA